MLPSQIRKSARMAQERIDQSRFHAIEVSSDDATVQDDETVPDLINQKVDLQYL